MQALKSRAQAKGPSTTSSSSGEDQPPLKFRNYQPYDTSLVREEVGEIAEVKKGGEDVIKHELAQIQSEEVNIAPRKANLDLKSQVAGNLDKLKRRTQRAIVDILRERLREEE